MNPSDFHPAENLNLLTQATTPPDSASKDASKVAMAALLPELTALQEKLYANRRQSLLVVLQGLDTSGKDGTIRQIFGQVSPFGLSIQAFKMPSAIEQAHDFLWRVHPYTPANGIIGIFNRSHYEAAVSDHVQGLCDHEIYKQRLRSICDFEQHLLANGTIILKFFLHISKKEQKERLLDRIRQPDKHWKISRSDLIVRREFEHYLSVWSDAISNSHSHTTPWYVIPADSKWYRDHIVMETVVDALRKLHQEYPGLAEPISEADVVD